ncbi:MULTISPECIES: DMT family transporter [Ramlibacter]|uniref:EamA family transporter n=1 Tax=Ramlibacter pinisoli TaxID=2682844 RepID=A0A6N8IU93_9BURK|nr:DMT family transporter [Ramlibacter sp. CGMCC 1.13660]MVQ30398.1 EamA family transporter [Ramlibacter pinisoli]
MTTQHAPPATLAGAPSPGAAGRAAPRLQARELRGLWLGLLGVAIFALTLPMTRLAVGTPAAPQLSGVFIALGRAVVAAGLSIAFLLATRAPLPRRGDWPALALTAAGVVFGFPLLTSVAMRYVEAVHAAVIIGVLPLATAAVGAWLHRQRPSAGFWACAGVGSLLVVAFALLRSGGSTLLHPADLLLLAATACAAVGYGWGARLSQTMRAEHVICWALVLALPLTLPLTWLSRPQAPVAAPAWWAFGYVAVFSMWLGFFAWYRGLSQGGTVRVSQVQLVQPFLSMLFAVPLLGERLDATSLGFALAVIATVFVGKKMPVHPTHRPPSKETA